MKHIKRLCYGLIAIVALAAVALFFGSRDSASFDDLGLLDQIRHIPDADNGYLQLAYTQTDDFRLFDDDSNKDALQQYISHEEWDQANIDTMLTNASQHIARALAASEYPHFQFAPNHDTNELPSYVAILNIHRLVLLTSINEARQNKLDSAIRHAEHAVLFSQAIKTESNNWLISHMIGLVMQYEALRWLNQLAVDYELTEQQYDQLLAIANRIPPYQQDGFAQVFAGEFVFAKNLMKQTVNRPLRERWETLQLGEDWWNIDYDSYGNVAEQGIKGRLFVVLNTLFPAYYLHENRTLNEAAKFYSSLSNKAAQYCSDAKAAETPMPELQWKHLLQTNAVGSRLLGNAALFDEYFTRRCLGHVHIQSVKSIIALKKYQRRHGELPNSLQDLVPDDLSELPMDAFGGGVLRYSPAKAYLYSLGANNTDNGGSSDAIFFKHCERSEACLNNPTLPILLAPNASQENLRTEAEYLGEND